MFSGRCWDWRINLNTSSAWLLWELRDKVYVSALYTVKRYLFTIILITDSFINPFSAGWLLVCILLRDPMYL